MTIESAKALEFRVTGDGYKNLPKMPESDYPGTEGFIGDVYENPDGSPIKYIVGLSEGDL